MYRLSESNFDPQTSTLNIDMHFILIGHEKSADTFSEVHKIRCYTLPEIEHYFGNNGLKLVSAYDSSDEGQGEFKRLQRETFRILTIARKT